MKFLKLTDITGHPIIINIFDICCVHEIDNIKTLITLKGDIMINVNESVEYIYDAIEGNDAKQIEALMNILTKCRGLEVDEYDNHIKVNSKNN